MTVRELKARLRGVEPEYPIAVISKDGRYTLRVEVEVADTHDGPVLLFSERALAK